MHAGFNTISWTEKMDGLLSQLDSDGTMGFQMSKQAAKLDGVATRSTTSVRCGGQPIDYAFFSVTHRRREQRSAPLFYLACYPFRGMIGFSTGASPEM